MFIRYMYVLVLLRIIPLEKSYQVSPFASLKSLFPNGTRGFFSSIILVMFSYAGTGIIGLAIADTDSPEKSAPYAIRTIIISVITLFVFSVLLIIWLVPWNSLSPSVSPFVSILNRLNIPYSDNILNFIVLTATLSGLNSSMYSSSRMINSLSRDKQAPKLFLKKNKNDVPIFALILSSFALLLTAVLSYLSPGKVFVILAASSGFLVLINWLTVTVTHYFYRKKTLLEHPEKLKYKAFGYPITNFIEVILILSIFVISFFTGKSANIIACIALLIFLLIIYFVLKRLKWFK